MLKYNRIIIHDDTKNSTTIALENLKNDEILLGSINGRKCMLKYLDDEELNELKKLIEIN